MALVTREITAEDVTYTITSIYPQIAINALFSFIIYNGYFRISEDNGDTWGEWDYLTNDSLHAVSVNMQDTTIVVQFKSILANFKLAINDDDSLLINDDDNLNIS